MAVNKGVFGNQTIIDSTNDDVTASDAASGKYFHLPNGQRTVGTGNASAYASIGVSYPAGEICECSNGVDTLQSQVESYNGDIVTFQAEEEVPLRDLSVDITPVQSGSGTPAYDNVRPITGWSNAKITRRTGKKVIEINVVLVVSR